MGCTLDADAFNPSMRLACQFTPVGDFNKFKKSAKYKVRMLKAGGPYRTLKVSARRLHENVGVTGNIRVCVLNSKTHALKKRAQRVAAVRCTRSHAESIFPYALSKEVDLVITVVEQNKRSSLADPSSICEANIEADLRDMAAHLRELEEQGV
jgi:hypothetical protein